MVQSRCPLPAPLASLAFQVIPGQPRVWLVGLLWIGHRVPAVRTCARLLALRLLAPLAGLGFLLGGLVQAGLGGTVPLGVRLLLLLVLVWKQLDAAWIERSPSPSDPTP